jgi:hypothetical protein
MRFTLNLQPVWSQGEAMAYEAAMEEEFMPKKRGNCHPGKRASALTSERTRLSRGQHELRIVDPVAIFRIGSNTERSFELPRPDAVMSISRRHDEP